MGADLTINAMNALSYAPIFFMLNGYWMISNQQIFENVVNQVDYRNETMHSSHFWETLAELTHATPLLWIGVVSVILILIRRIFFNWLKSWGYTISSKQIEVDENLPNFFNAVKVKHARWLVMESNYLKEEFGFTFSD